MNSILRWLTRPPVDGPAATLLLRLMCGGVFFWEGILKFVYTNQGIGRFTKLGMPFPGPTADVVAVLEIVGGMLLAPVLILLIIPVLISFLPVRKDVETIESLTNGSNIATHQET